MKSRKGFTLVELLGVLLILGIIAAISIPAVDYLLKKGQEDAYNAAVDNIVIAAKNWLSDNKTLFYSDGDFLTITLEDLKQGGYLPYDFRNPKSQTCFSNDSLVSIKKIKDEKHNMNEINIVDIFNGTEEDCKDVGEKPTIVLYGDNPLNIEMNSIYSEPGYVAKSVSGLDITADVIVTNEINAAKAGKYLVKYEVSNAEQTRKVTRTVAVTDNLPPVISGADDITIDGGSIFDVRAGVTLSDNSNEKVELYVSGNVNTSLPGIYKLTYTAVDLYGNKTTKIRNVTVTKSSYVLKTYYYADDFRKSEYRDKIIEVKFVDYVNTSNAIKTWDLSDNQKGTITGWIELTGSSYYKMYIGSVGNIYANPNSSNWFYGFGNLVSIDFSNFNTSNVTNMDDMFKSTSSLIRLDLSNWDTSNVTTLNGLFHFSGITELDLSNWDTSKVETMLNTFRYTKLISLDLEHFDMSNVTNIGGMFECSTSLTSIGLSSWNTSNVTNMGGLFNNTSINNIDVSNWDTSNVTNMANMFQLTANLRNLDVSNFDTSNVTNMNSMFNYTDIQSLDVSNWDTSNVTNMNYMFQYTSMKSIDLSNFDTSKVTTMTGMFAISKFESLNIENWNVGNVEYMDAMFKSSYVFSMNLSN